MVRLPRRNPNSLFIEPALSYTLVSAHRAGMIIDSIADLIERLHQLAEDPNWHSPWDASWNVVQLPDGTWRAEARAGHVDSHGRAEPPHPSWPSIRAGRDEALRMALGAAVNYWEGRRIDPLRIGARAVR